MRSHKVKYHKATVDGWTNNMREKDYWVKDYWERFVNSDTMISPVCRKEWRRSLCLQHRCIYYKHWRLSKMSKISNSFSHHTPTQALHKPFLCWYWANRKQCMPFSRMTTEFLKSTSIFSLTWAQFIFLWCYTQSILSNSRLVKHNII